MLAGSQFIVRFVLPRLIERLGEERILVYAFYCAAAGFLLAPWTADRIAAESFLEIGDAPADLGLFVAAAGERQDDVVKRHRQRIALRVRRH